MARSIFLPSCGSHPWLLIEFNMGHGDRPESVCKSTAPGLGQNPAEDLLSLGPADCQSCPAGAEDVVLVWLPKGENGMAATRLPEARPSAM